MNNVVLIGRTTGTPDVRYTQNGTAVGRYTLAVDRKYKREGEPSADFISCIAFGKTAEVAEKYFFKGVKIAVTGRIQTGSYTNKDGKKVYTTDVVVESQEFVESKSNGEAIKPQSPPIPADGKFHDIPDGIDEELPFV